MIHDIRNKLFTKIISVVTLVIIITVIVVYKKWGVPFISQEFDISIGVYEGKDFTELSESLLTKNPVIKAEDLTYLDARFVADPFVIKEGGVWYLFFEVFNNDTQHGDIALATSTDLVNWKHIGLVLDKAFHLSYPYVFKHQEQYYMLPESREAGNVSLYKAIDFPVKWEKLTDIIIGDYVDSSIIRHNGYWWVFAGANPDKNDTLRLFYSKELTGPWIEHNKSPIIENNPHHARPSGRLIKVDNTIIRFAQDDYPQYGKQVWAFKINKLNLTEYEEMVIGKKPIITASGGGWNEIGMHHIDLHKNGSGDWLAIVDAIRPKIRLDF